MSPTHFARCPITQALRCFALSCLALCLSLSLTTREVDAQTKSKRAEAQEVFKDGQDDFNAGFYKEASTKFLRAFQLDPHPVIMYNVARAHEETGELIKSLQYYRLLLGLKPSKRVRREANAKIEEIELFLRAQGVDVLNLETAEWLPTGKLTVITEPRKAEVIINGQSAGLSPILDHKLPQGDYNVAIEREGFAPELRNVTIIGGKNYTIAIELQVEALAENREPGGFLKITAPRRGLLLFVDGEPVGTMPVGQIELSPGEHTISVEGDDFPTFKTTVNITSEKTTTIKATLPQPVVVKEDPPLISQTTWGFVVLGIGGVAVGTGGIFGLLAQGNADDYATRRADFGRSTYRDNAETNALAADIFYGVGLATSLVGLTLILTDSAEETDDAYQNELVQWPDLNLEPVILSGPGAGVGLNAHGRW